MIAYKFLSRGAVGLFSRYAWPTPAGEEPGEWVRVDGEIQPCLKGIHACPPERLVAWIDEELWEIELEDPVVEAADGELVSQAGRITSRMAGWNDELAGTFVAHCVDNAVSVAAESLARSGRAAEAELLAASSGPDAERNVLEIARSFDGEPPSPVLFMADVKRLERATRPELADEAPAEDVGGPTWSAVAANLGFVCAHIAAQLGEEERSGVYGETFERERLSQSAWLAEKLQLAGHT